MVDLVVASDLAPFPGAPFDADVVTSAGETVRNICRWHIAPSATETVTVDGSGTEYLVLPTLNLTDVTAVRDVSGATPVTLTGWRKSSRGVLYLESGFPSGFQSIEVDISHGYAQCPAELLPIIAAMARDIVNTGRVKQETVGSHSLSYETGQDQATHGSPAAILARYRVPVI